MNTASRYAIFATLISDGQKISDGALAIEDDRIRFAGSRDDWLTQSDADQFPEHPVPLGSILIPGLIDLHNHGALGADFANPEHGQVSDALDYLHRAGTTTLLASLVTAEPAEMLRAAKSLPNSPRPERSPASTPKVRSSPRPAAAPKTHDSCAIRIQNLSTS